MKENDYYWIRLETGWCPARKMNNFWLHCKDKTTNQKILEIGPVIIMPKEKKMKNQLEKGDIIRVHGRCFPYLEIGVVYQAYGRGWTDFEITNFEPVGDFYWYICISLSGNQKSKEFT